MDDELPLIDENDVKNLADEIIGFLGTRFKTTRSTPKDQQIKDAMTSFMALNLVAKGTEDVLSEMGVNCNFMEITKEEYHELVRKNNIELVKE